VNLREEKDRRQEEGGKEDEKGISTFFDSRNNCNYSTYDAL
jgi:hypothetical protein